MNFPHKLLYLILFISSAYAQFGDIFEQLFRQQAGHAGHGNHQQAVPEDSNWMEQQYDKQPCDKYLCQDTLSCVSSQLDCPCPFPSSQTKCILPDKKSYVCISNPADANDADTRDCSFVTKAWKGLV